MRRNVRTQRMSKSPRLLPALLLLPALVASCALADGLASQASTTSSTSTTTHQGTSTTRPDPGQVVFVYGRDLAQGAPAIATIDMSGTVIEVLSRDIQGEAADFFYDASAHVLYFVIAQDPCDPEIMRMDPGSPSIEHVLRGAFPVVSPDGRYLAYTSDPQCLRQHNIHVRDLSDGTERIWHSELAGAQSDLIASVESMSWSADSNSIAIEVVLEDGTEVRIVDVATQGGEIFDQSRLDAPVGSMWSTPVFLSDGSLLVTESCCELSMSTHKLVQVDLNASVSEVLADLGARPAVVSEHPTSNGWLLILMATPGGVSQLWSFDGKDLNLITEGVDAAAWSLGHAGPVTP